MTALTERPQTCSSKSRSCELAGGVGSTTAGGPFPRLVVSRATATDSSPRTFDEGSRQQAREVAAERKERVVEPAVWGSESTLIRDAQDGSPGGGYEWTPRQVCARASTVSGATPVRGATVADTPALLLVRTLPW